jgi:hypothetical protein
LDPYLVWEGFPDYTGAELRPETASSLRGNLTCAALFVVVQLDYVRETKNCSRLLDLAMDASLVCNIHAWLTMR